MTTELVLMLASVLVAIAGSTNAATLTHLREYGPFLTNWQTVLAFPQFNGTLGFLKETSVTILAEASGAAWLENTDRADYRNVNVTLGASIDVWIPSRIGWGIGSKAVVSTRTFITNVTSYDGITDFAGPSALVFSNLTSSKVGEVKYTVDDAVFAFIGSGDFTLPVMAKYWWYGSAGSNWYGTLQIRAKARISVSYTYKPFDGCTSLSLIQRMEDLSGRLHLQTWTSETYLNAMKACTGANVTASPDLTRGVAVLEGILAGGFLNPRTLAYSERGFGGVPAAPALAVGPSHLITVVRSSFGRAFYRVYIKEPWLQVKQSFLTQYHRSNTICRTGPFVGAPNALYDHLADRWLIMELARSNATGSYFLCLVLSLTSVPYGLLYRGFAIALPGNPGEIAVSVMPDAYYIGTSEDPPAVYALDRTRYLAGGTIRPMARLQAAALSGLALQGLMPGHLAGRPRAGSSCGLFARPVDDELHSQSPDAAADFVEVWEMCPSFDDATAARLSQLANVRVSEFDASICGSSADASCFAQPGSATRLTTYHAGMPARVAHRSFHDHESLLVTFAVDGGNDKGAVMWVELRRSVNSSSGALGPWERVQDGSTPSDGKTRWLPSAAIDRSGDIALVYSLVDAGIGIYPSLYYTGRGAAAPNGTMPSPETLLAAGTSASATSSFGGRSAMAVDPVDGCGFYLLGPWEITASRSATYMGAVRFARCADSAECLLDSDCDDDQFCTLDKCRDGNCVREPDGLLCRYGEICDEVADVCRAP
eukprot:jgi/Mesvir1/892/Mv17455-RA.2